MLKVSYELVWIDQFGRDYGIREIHAIKSKKYTGKYVAFFTNLDEAETALKKLQS